MLLHSVAKAPLVPWKIYWFIPSSGRNNFAKWDAKLSLKGRIKRNTALKYLRVEPLSRWTRPEASPLGNHLYVIHFSDENGAAHRMCGFIDLSNHAFVICVTMIEKDGKYNPDDYEARTLKAQLEIQSQFKKFTLECPWGNL